MSTTDTDKNKDPFDGWKEGSGGDLDLNPDGWVSYEDADIDADQTRTPEAEEELAGRDEAAGANAAR